MFSCQQSRVYGPNCNVKSNRKLWNLFRFAYQKFQILTIPKAQGTSRFKYHRSKLDK
jgi:hypothetical protein